MIIAIPRERKQGERRVAITPDGSRELVSLGHTVLIEKGAGELSGFLDAEYRNVGAKIVDSLDDIWGHCELLVKVKEPAAEEIKLFRPGLAVFCFFHLAVFPELAKALLTKGITALDYDLLMFDDARLPILEPMSVIAGKLAIQCGAYALQAGNDGRGVLLGGSVGVPSGKVVVIGAGAAGSNAARVAIGMGAEVSILDVNPVKLLPFCEGYYRARTLHSTTSAIEREIANADLIIGSILIPGALAPKLITRKMLAGLRKGTVIVDICIDQGGVAESSRPTSIAEPTYVESGVIHFCVPNMPALVPRTSTRALTNATLHWIKLLADGGVVKTLQTSMPVRRSLITYQGQLTNRHIGEALGVQAKTSEAQLKEILG